MNPLNQLPTNPEWARACEAAVKRAAEDTGSAVVMVAIQEGGKMAVLSHGAPETGELAEALSDMPEFFQALSIMCSINERIENAAPRS